MKITEAREQKANSGCRKWANWLGVPVEGEEGLEMVNPSWWLNTDYIISLKVLAKEFGIFIKASEKLRFLFDFVFVSYFAFFKVLT